MKTYIKFAWRNLWRRKVRTILTAVIVFIFVILAAFMGSQQFGVYDRMIENVTEFSGHLQVQDTGYKENKSINYAIQSNDSMMLKIENTPGVVAVIPRLESFSLANNLERTKGVAVIGIDIEKEKKSTKFHQKIIQYKITEESIQSIKDTAIRNKLEEQIGKTYTSEKSFLYDMKFAMPKVKPEKLEPLVAASKTTGSYLQQNDDGVLIGDKLSKFLKVGVGDTLVMIGQGYHGVSAQGLFPVRGIVKLPLPAVEQRLVVMEINNCQTYFSAYDMLTTILINADSDDHIDAIKQMVAKDLGNNITVDTWRDLQPETVQMIESDKAGGYMMKFILYMIIGFIIFAVLMMIMAERKREFGILTAIGMKKWKLAIVVFLETLFISFLGAVIGFLCCFPFLTFMSNNPIPLQGKMAQVMLEYGMEPAMYFSNAPHIFINQAITIFVLCILIFIFPLIKILSFNIIKALRG